MAICMGVKMGIVSWYEYWLWAWREELWNECEEIGNKYEDVGMVMVECEVGDEKGMVMNVFVLGW